MIGDHAFHVVGEKYIDAVRDGAGCLPFLIPVLDPPIKPEELLPHVDGLLFTGSASNVAPHLYGGHEPRNPKLLDEARDASTLPLMRIAEEARMPMFAICRGFQELNVAFGGTLHQHMNESGFEDHSVGDRKRSLDRQYGPVHDVIVEPGGVLRLARAQGALQGEFAAQPGHRPPGAAVAQGGDRARRRDRSRQHGAAERAFCWPCNGIRNGGTGKIPVSKAMFAAFGDAVREHAKKRADR